MGREPSTSSSEEEPGRRAPAPGSLRLVQRFLNTVDIEAGDDAFASPRGVRLWFVDAGLLSRGARLGEAERRLAVEAREALRDVVGANAGVRVPPESVEFLNRLGRGALDVRFDEQGRAALVAGTQDVRAGLAAILAAVEHSMAEGTWPRLKVCRRDVCRWVFYDRSKNRSGAWCTMSICGSRTKAASYYRRRSAAAR